MGLADLTTVRKRVVQLLNANPDAWSSLVSGDVGAFPYDLEIEQAIFEAESLIIREGYLNSINPSLASGFSAIGVSLSSGDLTPQIRGNSFTVEVSQNGSVWEKATEANTLDDVVGLNRFSTYIEPFAGKYLYKISDGRIYTGAVFARIKSLAYTKTNALQVDEGETFLIIATAIRLLTRHASPVPFEFYAQESARGIQQLQQDGMYSQAARQEG